MRYLHWSVLVLTLLGVAACEKQPPAESTAPVAATPATPPADTADVAAIEASIANPSRPAADREEDPWRQPAEVLKFLEVRPGERVIDYFAAGGYYSELLSHTVGPQGSVIAYNNAPYLQFAGEKPAQRYGDNRLPNVAQLTTPPEEVPLDPESLDAALFVQSYHDLYWRPKDNSWPVTDPAKALAKLVPALKPGAVVVVVDHVAAAGGDPAQTVDALHRIDPAIVKRDFEAAGLTFVAESPVFKNPADDHSKPVFDPAIRHKTDQVVYKFRKG